MAVSACQVMVVCMIVMVSAQVNVNINTNEVLQQSISPDIFGTNHDPSPAFSYPSCVSAVP